MNTIKENKMVILGALGVGFICWMIYKLRKPKMIHVETEEAMETE